MPLKVTTERAFSPANILWYDQCRCSQASHLGACDCRIANSKNRQRAGSVSVSSVVNGLLPFANRPHLLVLQEPDAILHPSRRHQAHKWMHGLTGSCSSPKGITSLD